MRPRFAASIAIALFLSGGSALAQNTNARDLADKSLDQAQSALQTHEYGAAAAAFEQAATLVPHPSAWLSAAEARQDAGDWVGAATDCDHALALKEIASAYTEEAEARLAQSKPHVATLELRGDPSFTVSVDRGELHRFPQLIRLVPGTHDVTVVASGKKLRQVMTLAAGETKLISLQLTPALAQLPLRSPEYPHARGPDMPSILAFGAGSFFLAGGLLFGGVTIADKSSFDASPSEDSLDRFKRDRAVCDILIGTAVIAGAFGLYLWATQPTLKGDFEARR